jgi:HAD superfamily hydrolase (TIGR01549 family)
MKSNSRSNQRPTEPAILFDLDGTLVDTVYEHVVAWSHALKQAGLMVPHWAIHRRIGMSGTSLLKQLLRPGKSPNGSIDLKAIENGHDAAFQDAAENAVLLPGANELLQHLTEQKIRWAIATTGNRQQTEKLLKPVKISKGTIVVTGNDVQKAKPSPDVFIVAAERLETPIQDCVVVGDSVWDMLAAGRKNALGVGFLAGGYSTEELGQAGAFRVYTDPADMLLHIEDLGIPGE